MKKLVILTAAGAVALLVGLSLLDHQRSGTAGLTSPENESPPASEIAQTTLTAPAEFATPNGPTARAGETAERTPLVVDPIVRVADAGLLSTPPDVLLVKDLTPEYLEALQARVRAESLPKYEELSRTEWREMRRISAEHLRRKRQIAMSSRSDPELRERVRKQLEERDKRQQQRMQQFGF